LKGLGSRSGSNLDKSRQTLPFSINGLCDDPVKAEHSSSMVKIQHARPYVQGSPFAFKRSARSRILSDTLRVMILKPSFAQRVSLPNVQYPRETDTRWGRVVGRCPSHALPFHAASAIWSPIRSLVCAYTTRCGYAFLSVNLYSQVRCRNTRSARQNNK
jgi:hypothetical protein